MKKHNPANSLLKSISDFRKRLDECPILIAVTCNPPSYGVYLDLVNEVEKKSKDFNKKYGYTFEGVQVFMVNSQKEEALLFYDDKVLREYLKNNP